MIADNMENNFMTEQYLHKEITSKIISCFYKVYNELGYGFLEKVYENALKIELENNEYFTLDTLEVNVISENTIES